MAHVLLPCDLPSWPDVQRHLSQLSACKDTHQMARLMASLYDLCRVSLDPDDAQRTDQGHPGILELRRFVEEELSEEERTRFLSYTLPRMASKASNLKQLKPSVGFLYSLRREECRFELDKVLVSSLLANAFFSTFAKRNSKTHPTLQDFRMIHFFAHLQKRGHQSKFRAFLRYFDSPDEEGHLTFVRKVLQQGPSLPGWLCSDRPLAPLNVRPEGSVHQAEPGVYRISPCSPLIGGDVLTEANSKESRLFFSFPELLIILSFAEGLVDDEALIAENAGMQGCCFCFLDPLREEPGRQFEDRFLLRELNKALAAFTFQQEGCNSRRGSQSRKDSKQHRRGVFEKRFSSKNSSKVSMRTASQSSVDPLPLKEENYYTADEDSEEGPGLTEETSFSRSTDSLGFVLGEESEEDLPSHERLGDFRKRIWKRTRRRLSRRRSSSSYAGSSSDMDDILEDPEPCPLPFPLRPASSEPSLHVATSLALSPQRSPLSEAAEAVLVQMSGKRMMVTSSNGHLKAYSYDGVSPNLPVPFRARFRQRAPEESPSIEAHTESERLSMSPQISCERTDQGHRVAFEAEGEDLQLRVSILWLAASMAQLQSLILYTLGHEQLREVCRVRSQAVKRDWTVGDLSCEVLRFCRNRRRNSPLQLFQQIVGRTPSQDPL